MKKNVLSIIASMIFLCSYAQTPLPYNTGFDTPADKAAWPVYRTGSTMNGTWAYQAMSSFSTPSCVIHYYPVGGSQETIDWLVSPAFNFAGGGKIDSVRASFTGFGVPATMDTVAIYLLKGSPNPNMASSKTLLFDFRGTNYMNDGTWRKIANIMIPPTSGQSYIAFYYRTTINWLDVKFDNLALSASGSAPVASFSTSSSSTCKGQTITLTDQSTNAPASWSWQFPGGTPATATASNPSVTYANPGTYTISLMSSNSVGQSAVTTKTVSINSCAGFSEIGTYGTSIQVYPNPNNGKFTIQSGEAGSGDFVLCNLLGEIITTGHLEENGSVNIDIGSQSSGIYTLKIENPTKSTTIKLLKE